MGRYKIEWKPKGENVWEDTFQATDDLKNAIRVAKAWKMGMFCYDKPENARIVDTVEKKVIEVKED